MVPLVLLSLAGAALAPGRTARGSSRRRTSALVASLPSSGWGRPLGNMEKLLNSRRSWSGSLTTAHVSGSILSGPTPTEAELLLALEWTVRRHPLLRAIVVGRGKHYVPDAKPFALHDNYLQKAIEGKPELFRPEPDSDPPRFEPSILAAAELARRGLTVDDPSSDVSADLKLRFSRALDELSFDPCGDGPLWSLRLIPPAKGGKGSALLWAANHAISDQLSHNQVCHGPQHIPTDMHG